MIEGFNFGEASDGDDSFDKVMWESLPADVRERFTDEAQISVFMRKVEKKLREVGLELLQVGIGVDPINGRAILQLQTFWSEEEAQFQTDKELASMMYDEKKSKTEDYLEELKRAAAEGDKGALGF